MELLLPVFALVYALGVGPASASTYLGCYVDFEGRGSAGNNVESAKMTPQFCIDHCTKSGFKLAGLKLGSQCFCGDDLDENNRVAESECSRPCRGMAKTMCGGSWRLSVHRTTVPGFNPVKGNYVGCYSDNSGRVLNGIPRNVSNSQTPQACLELCKSKGFRYSGTEVGWECFCGNSLNGGVLSNDHECNAPCYGDGDIKCGGPWLLSVYYTSRFNPVKENFVGCYVDNDKRVMNGIPRSVSNSQTPKACLELCRSKGFQYSGTEAGNECFCGKSLNEMVQVEDEECYRPCYGDAALICGGPWRLSVYSKTGYNPSKGSYVGCYVDSPNRLLTGTPTNYSFLQTPQACADLCRRTGFKYSGTEDRWECYCGDSLKGGTIVDDEECNQPCTGDNSLRCGGAWRLSVFNNSDNYAGCYIDYASRLLNGVERTSSRGQTPQACLELCRSKGFKYSGTELGNDCYCGDSLKEGTLVSDRECYQTCSGNRALKCGAPWRLSVYHTYGEHPPK